MAPPDDLYGLEERQRLRVPLWLRLTQGVSAEALIDENALRDSVLEDLTRLLNTSRPEPPWGGPVLEDCVVNYGLPPLAGVPLSRIDLSALEECLHDTLLRFEPRLLPEELSIKAHWSDDPATAQNRVYLEISGKLWATPLPLEVLLRTEVDLESGRVEVRDAARR